MSTNIIFGNLVRKYFMQVVLVLLNDENIIFKMVIILANCKIPQLDRLVITP